MKIITNDLKGEIMKLLDSIMNLKNDLWELLEKEIKVKIIHHYCNLLSNKTDIDNIHNSNSKIKTNTFIIAGLSGLVLLLIIFLLLKNYNK